MFKVPDPYIGLFCLDLPRPGAGKSPRELVRDME